MSEHQLEATSVEEQARREGKPTLLDLWHRHPELRDKRIIEAPGIPYIQVVYAFSGFPVTQEVFDAVLMAINRLAGTSYTRDDIAGVRIMPQERDGV